MLHPGGVLHFVIFVLFQYGQVCSSDSPLHSVSHGD